MPSVRFFQIRNWSEFQHYTDRDPPWIKLYNRLLSDYEFLQLPDHAKWHLVGLWLLASQTKNRLPCDPAYLRGRLGSSHDVDLELLAPWIEPVDCGKPSKSRNSNKLHTAEHDASNTLVPEEKRREREETEAENIRRSDERELSANEKVTTDTLLGAWIDLQPIRPSDKAIGKQGAVAKRICANRTDEAIHQACTGMSKLYPHSDGEPWDLFDLERKFDKAVQAAMNGRSRSREPGDWLDEMLAAFPDDEDMK